MRTLSENSHAHRSSPYNRHHPGRSAANGSVRLSSAAPNIARSTTTAKATSRKHKKAARRSTRGPRSGPSTRQSDWSLHLPPNLGVGIGTGL